MGPLSACQVSLFWLFSALFQGFSSCFAAFLWSCDSAQILAVYRLKTWQLCAGRKPKHVYIYTVLGKSWGAFWWDIRQLLDQTHLFFSQLLYQQPVANPHWYLYIWWFLCANIFSCTRHAPCHDTTCCGSKLVIDGSGERIWSFFLLKCTSSQLIVKRAWRSYTQHLAL